MPGYKLVNIFEIREQIFMRNGTGVIYMKDIRMGIIMEFKKSNMNEKELSQFLKQKIQITLGHFYPVR